MLQIQDKFHLEDCTGAIELDVSQATTHTGLFTEGCQVLCEGWAADRVLHVAAIGKNGL